MPLAIAVELSENKKTGPVSATYASQASCPRTCPFLRNGCYAENGPIGIHTNRLNKSGPASALDIAMEEADKIMKLSGRWDLRLHVVGDCTTDKAAQLLSLAATRAVKRDRKAWTYTHAWRTVERASWGQVNVLASCESANDVEAARDKGYATAMVVKGFQGDSVQKIDGVKVLPCPNQTRGVQCVDCRLCLDAERLHGKGISIGFTPHGAVKGRVLKVLG